MINKLSTKTRAIARATNSSKAKAKAKHRRSMAFMSSKQQGFTLIELLVVVSILAALAGITSVAMDGYQQDAEEKITRVEMQRIAGAIRRFKADTGYWPKTETNGTSSYDGVDSAANLNFLFTKPNVNIPDWSPEYAIGWNGPYINLDGINAITIDTLNPNLGCSGSGETHEAAVDNLTRMNGLVDRFQQIREKNSGIKYCVLANFNIGDTDSDGKDDWQFKVAEYSGSPYLYETAFDHTDSALCDSDDSASCIVLRSFGPDGIDDGGSDASDDIVFVLEVN